MTVTPEELDHIQSLCEERDRRLTKLRAGGEDIDLDYVERHLTSEVTNLVANTRRQDAEIVELRRHVTCLNSQVSVLSDELRKSEDLEDARERLRDIGKVIGCDHVDDDGGRLRLVHCVEETFAERDAEIERLRDELSLWKPMTPEEAERAYDEAEAVPMAPGEAEAIIEKMMASINDPLYRPSEPEYVQLVVEIRRLRKEVAGLKLLHAIANHNESDD